MELTENHIAKLYQFTQEHYVEWYDLQTELVDHLAADIEEIGKGNPSIPFEEARDISFKKFGIFGFGEIVEQKQKALTKQYWRMIWKEFKSFFKIPKIILIIFFSLGTYSLFSVFNSGNFIATLFVLTMILIPIYKGIAVNKKIKKRNSLTNKKWLIDDFIFRQELSSYSLSIFVPNIIDIILKPSYSENQIIILTAFFVAFNLIFYISSEIVSKKLENKIGEQFSEYQPVH